jgi:hypothetical protein
MYVHDTIILKWALDKCQLNSTGSGLIKPKGDNFWLCSYSMTSGAVPSVGTDMYHQWTKSRSTGSGKQKKNSFGEYVTHTEVHLQQVSLDTRVSSRSFLHSVNFHRIPTMEPRQHAVRRNNPRLLMPTELPAVVQKSRKHRKQRARLTGVIYASA